MSENQESESKNEEMEIFDYSTSSQQENSKPTVTEDTPVVPISPSIMNNDNTPSPSAQTAEEKERQQQSLKHREIVRKKNLEERSFCLFNICFCFMFPFVCRCKPIKDEDIPSPMEKDTSKVVMKRLDPAWFGKYKEYISEKEKYEAKKKELEEAHNTEELFAFIFYSIF